MEYWEHRKPLGNEEQGGGNNIAQNGQGLRLFGDLAWQPKPLCYPDGFLYSKHVEDRRWIQFRYGRDRYTILGTLSI
jgi:hypothetical protein